MDPFFLHEMSFTFEKTIAGFELGLKVTLLFFSFFRPWNFGKTQSLG